MQINVKFFASLREQVGIESQDVEVGEKTTVSAVWQMMVNQPAPDNCLCSRNRQYAEWDDQVESGDEVAFFPPVTGG